jgi:hypothetical protein
MADTISKAVQAVEVTKPAEDTSKHVWVSIPAEDLFGDSHYGVSINFRKFTPELDENGHPTGKDGEYFLDPETAAEVNRLLKVALRSQMRVMQPGQDKKMAEIMNRGSKYGAPVHANKF